MLMDARRRGTPGMRNERVADLASEHVAGASGGRWSFGILIVSGGRRGCFEAGLAVPVDPSGSFHTATSAMPCPINHPTKPGRAHDVLP